MDNDNITQYKEEQRLKEALGLDSARGNEQFLKPNQTKNPVIVGTGIFTYIEKCQACKVLSKVDINGFCEGCLK